MPKHGQRHASLWLPLRTITITYPSLIEWSGSLTAIPTTEPGTGQLDHDIVSGDLPTVTPLHYGVDYSAVVYASGKVGATGRTLNWRIVKNGTSQGTGSSFINPNRYWTLSGRLSGIGSGIVDGDNIELRLWASGSGLEYDYTALFIAPTRLYVVPEGEIVVDVNATVSTMPSWSIPSPSVGIISGSWDSTGMVADAYNDVAIGIGDASEMGPTYGLYRSGGDPPTGAGVLVSSTSTTDRGTIVRGDHPTEIAFRPFPITR